MVIPTHRVHGSSEGPHLLIMAGVHGDEFESMEAIRRLRSQIDDRRIRGRITLAPLINEPAFLRGHRTADDDLDLARTFPGQADGSITQQIAQAAAELIRTADYVIDLHTGGTQLAVYPLAGYMLHPRSDVLDVQRRMARAFALPLVWGTSPELDGRSMSVCRDAGIPAIYAEYRGAATCSALGVELYVRGCWNVIEELRMGSRPHSEKSIDVPMFGDPRTQLIVEDERPGSGHMQVCNPAAMTGMWSPAVRLGAHVQVHDLLGTISDALGDEVVQVRTDTAGAVIVLRTFPRVLVGDALAVVMETNGSLPPMESEPL